MACRAACSCWALIASVGAAAASPWALRREDVEDLCTAAVKEEAIETKLKAVAEQWAQEIFTFADHKSRGPVVLKVGG